MLRADGERSRYWSNEEYRDRSRERARGAKLRSAIASARAELTILFNLSPIATQP
jgi:hypothetical protein